jgi:phosphotransacetylase
MVPDALLDASYFCTLMVYTGDADGLEGPIQYDAAVGASVAGLVHNSNQLTSGCVEFSVRLCF